MTQTKKLIALFLYVFLVLSLIPIQVKADTATFGYTANDGGDDVPGGAGRIFSGLFASGAAGYMTKITAYTKANAINGTIQGVLYDDALVLKGVTDHVVLGVGLAEYECTFAVPVAFNDDDYYLCFQTDVAAVPYIKSGAHVSGYRWDDPVGGWDNQDDPIVWDGNYDTWILNIYATYTPSGGGQNRTFGLAENIHPSGASYFQKALGFQLSGTASYFTYQLLGKELMFRPVETIRFWDSAIALKAFVLTLFEKFEPIHIDSYLSFTLPLAALTLDIAVAIAVLALVLSITGISIVFLRRRRDQ